MARTVHTQLPGRKYVRSCRPNESSQVPGHTEATRGGSAPTAEPTASGALGTG